MKFNLPIAAAVALIPMLIGFIWYNPKVLGKAWMESAGLTEEKMKGANMPVIFGLAYVFSLMLAIFSHTLAIHQFGLQSLVMVPENGVGLLPGSQEEFTRLMGIYGHSFRTFGHGVVHGIVTSIFLVLPILGTNALFERKGWKYILINWGFWAVSLALMLGTLCKFA